MSSDTSIRLDMMGRSRASMRAYVHLDANLRDRRIVEDWMIVAVLVPRRVLCVGEGLVDR